MTQDIRDATMVGGGGYDSDNFKNTIRFQICDSVIPGKSNRIVPIEYYASFLAFAGVMKRCIRHAI